MKKIEFLDILYNQYVRGLKVKKRNKKELKRLRLLIQDYMLEIEAE